MGSCGNGVDLLGFSDALNKARFQETTVGGLSGLAPLGDDRYLALVDNERDTPARVYTLRLPLANATPGEPQLLAVTTLRMANGAPFTGRNFDGEALVVLPNGDLLIASETEPAIRRFAPDGRLLGELPVPARFGIQPRGEATINQSFESLALTPGGHTLYTAGEGALAPDGFDGSGHARIRILRYDAAPDGSFLPGAQFFYPAEVLQGVAEIVALDDDHILVLERGFLPGLGNTIRIFRVTLSGATDVRDLPGLANAPPLSKELLADIVNCPASGARHPARQANPLLDNYESMALGPLLPDGRRVLLLLSDDNFGNDQVTRLLALAFHP